MAKTQSDPFPDQDDEEAMAELVQSANSKTDVVARSNNTVSVNGQEVSPQALKAMSFEDLAAAFGAPLDVTTDVPNDQFGPILKNKNRLVGEPFLIVFWEFHSGDFVKGFVSAAIMTRHNERFIINDGSTGICDHLRMITAEKGITGNVFCPNGLSASTYDIDADGNPTDDKTLAVGKNTTYYLDTKLMA